MVLSSVSTSLIPKCLLNEHGDMHSHYVISTCTQEHAHTVLLSYFAYGCAYLTLVPTCEISMRTFPLCNTTIFKLPWTANFFPHFSQAWNVPVCLDKPSCLLHENLKFWLFRLKRNWFMWQITWRFVKTNWHVSCLSKHSIKLDIHSSLKMVVDTVKLLKIIWISKAGGHYIG